MEQQQQQEQRTPDTTPELPLGEQDVDGETEEVGEELEQFHITNANEQQQQQQQEAVLVEEDQSSSNVHRPLGDRATNTEQTSTISSERFQTFKRVLQKVIRSDVFTGPESQRIAPIDSVMKAINDEMAQEEKFTDFELESGLEKMQEDNKIFLAEGKVWTM